MKQPIDYLIRVRRNSDLALLAEVSNYARLDAIPRFNDVGRWTLEIGEETAAALYLTSKANGIVLERNVHDGNGFVPFLSGPIDHIERQGGTVHNLLISGPDDNIVLKDRLALPNPTTYPLSSAILALPGILRYYKLNETSGTTATDSKSAVNGTYSGGYTLAQLAVADDSALNPLFDGSSGVVTAAGTGLPTGNSSMYIGAFFYYNSLPAANSVLYWYGNTTEGTRTGLFGFVQTNGTVAARSDASTSTTAAGFAGPGRRHLLGVMWDGTNLTCWLDGVQVGTLAPGALNLAASAFHIAEKITTGFFPGYVGHVFAGSGTLTAAQWLSTYQLGFSRQAYQYSDHQSGKAETVLKHYVNVNAGPGAIASRQTSGLTIEADAAQGSTVTADARFDDLLDLLKTVAVAGGDLGFKVVQVGTSLQFQVYQPPDVSSNAKFSEQLGNLADFAYSIDAPTANYLYGAGQGDGTARTFYEQGDSTSITDWSRRIEAFYDDRGASDLDTLVNDTGAQLAQDAEKTTFQAQPIDTDALQAFVDYDLGSKVSIIVNGSSVTDLIREVEITVTPGGASVVKPGIGTVGSGQIEAIITAYQKELKKLKTLVQRLQAHQ